MKLTILLAFYLMTINTHAASFTVANSSDSGPGSFRQAILDANSSIESDTITFNTLFLPVILASNLPSIGGPTVIYGNNALINGVGQYTFSTIFRTTEIYNLTFQNGFSTSDVGLKVNTFMDTCILLNCSFNQNTANSGSGALFLQSGYLIVENCEFNNNSTSGINSGTTVLGSGGVGATFSDCTFTNNSSTSNHAIANFGVPLKLKGDLDYDDSAIVKLIANDPSVEIQDAEVLLGNELTIEFIN